MPQRPPLHRPPGAGAERRALQAQQRQRALERPTSTDRGYDADWRVARAAHLAAHPRCSVDGCPLPATIVDHVETVATRPDLRLEPSNFRSFCHGHHSQRTAREQAHDDKPRGSAHPLWLPRSRVPLVVVCGPPAAGKSTFVAERAGANDLVLDPADITARVSGFPIYTAPVSFRDAMLRWRNSRLALLGYAYHRWQQGWLVVSEPEPQWRQWWRDHVGAHHVDVLEVDAATCVARIEADDRRPPAVRERSIAAVHHWWRTYERHASDIVHRPGERVTTGAALRRQGGRVG